MKKVPNRQPDHISAIIWDDSPIGNHDSSHAPACIGPGVWLLALRPLAGSPCHQKWRFRTAQRWDVTEYTKDGYTDLELI